VALINSNTIETWHDVIKLTLKSTHLDLKLNRINHALTHSSASIAERTT